MKKCEQCKFPEVAEKSLMPDKFLELKENNKEFFETKESRKCVGCLRKPSGSGGGNGK